MKSLCIIPFVALCCIASAQTEAAKNSFPEEIDGLIQSYQFTKALALLNAMDDSLSIEVLKRKGNCYHQLGNYNEAITAYEKIIEIDTMNVGVLLSLGQVYARQKQYGGSFICYTKLIAMDSLNSYYYKQFGIVAANANIAGVAIQNFFKALELNPGDIESCGLLAEMLIEGSPEMAEKVLKKTMAITSSPYLTLQLARAQLGEKKYREAIRTTQKLMVNGDTLVAHARLMGISHFQLKEYEEAIYWLNILVDREVKAEWVYYYMGLSYQNLNRHDIAIYYLNKAVEAGISDEIGEYYVQLAWSYEAVKNYKLAIKYYKVAYDETKDNFLLYRLGCSYDVFYKDKAQAIAYFTKYLESEDTVKVAREYSRLRLNELAFYR